MKFPSASQQKSVTVTTDDASTLGKGNEYRQLYVQSKRRVGQHLLQEEQSTATVRAEEAGRRVLECFVSSIKQRDCRRGLGEGAKSGEARGGDVAARHDAASSVSSTVGTEDDRCVAEPARLGHQVCIGGGAIAGGEGVAVVAER
ncbi:hypothetical protein B296_00027924 [Ensete ventricosum]|uniref:Uncharacterized protein n=1 Tax=Ensete ventricosum TaxID=4639 RepID=A0A426ZDP5_ENSVE|nr:hypothetical protein B296_00027924 [Ensete ventricosum]